MPTHYENIRIGERLWQVAVEGETAPVHTPCTWCKLCEKRAEEAKKAEAEKDAP